MPIRYFSATGVDGLPAPSCASTGLGQGVNCPRPVGKLGQCRALGRAGRKQEGMFWDEATADWGGKGEVGLKPAVMLDPSLCSWAA